MGEQRSRKKVESARTSEVNSEEERVLSPIEEESESVVSSVGTLGDFTISDDAEGSNYQTSVSIADERRKSTTPAPVQFQRKWIAPENTKNTRRGESTCEEDEEIAAREGICGFFRDRRLPDRYKSVAEASGDNDEVPSSHRGEKNLKTTVECLKNRLSHCDREIVTLKKQLDLEKFHSRRFVLQYHEKSMKTHEALKNDLLIWRSNLESRIKSQMVRWQLEERKRTNDEVARITELYSQEMLKTLQKDMKEWQAEDSKGIVEMIESERSRREHEEENARKIYENIQGHLENLESRNKKSYLSFRKQIDAWEERLRNEIVKLHETNLKDLQEQFKPWCEEMVVGWCNASFSRSSAREESEARRLAKSPTKNRDQSSNGAGRSDEEIRELSRWIEQILKREMKGLRADLTARLNQKIDELWIAFDRFKHNFQLDRAYRGECYFKQRQDEVDSMISEIFSESSDRRTLTIDSGTNTDI